MDLGIRGRRAIVCAASKGLGRACAFALAEAGVDLVICARGTEALDATAREIRARTGVAVTAVRCDVTTEEGRRLLLDACPAPDILITNAGGPPPGDFKDFELDDWRRALEANMLAPIALTRATVYGMMERGFGRILHITSAAVKAPIPMLELSNGARAGLAGAMAVLARKAVRRNVTINALLPGPFDTDRLRATIALQARREGRDPAVVAAERAAAHPAGRFGNPAEFGAFCAFLCSVHAGYVTGQNILIDGGAYPGLL
ncbi:MAG: SDR family oxidoreductase [Geminicoccaceae bacterium]|nr:SDR family oxidoreductase [Geminicoccaceae bacterium]